MELIATMIGGLQDVRIVRFLPERPNELATYVNTGGRPLGLKFNGADQERVGTTGSAD